MIENTEDMTDLEYILQTIVTAVVKMLKNGINSVMLKLRNFINKPNTEETGDEQDAYHD